MRIRIKNIRLKTIIGIFDWERTTPQDVLINVQFEIDGSRVAKSDSIKDCVDYKTMTHGIVDKVAKSNFKTLEALSNFVLGLVLEQDGVLRAEVEVDKPGALRYSESVSVTCRGERAR
jgi:FolB domain-containing protein